MLDCLSGDSMEILLFWGVFKSASSVCSRGLWSRRWRGTNMTTWCLWIKINKKVSSRICYCSQTLRWSIYLSTNSNRHSVNLNLYSCSYHYISMFIIEISVLIFCLFTMWVIALDQDWHFERDYRRSNITFFCIVYHWEWIAFCLYVFQYFRPAYRYIFSFFLELFLLSCDADIQNR